jgi:DNA-binding response OmpR family regulator
MNPKILLVDDNEDLLLITQIILKGQGYDIVLARSLEEAHKKIRIHQPVLLLLDVSLADGDGREFCEELKSNKETDHIKVIMMSGDDSDENRNTCAEAFLPKPFDFNQLVETVNGIMSYEPVSYTG